MEYNDEYLQELKDECPISDSELCGWAGKNGCMPCYIRSMKDDDDKQKALENWKVMLSNLPRDIDSLHESDKCVLCKGEPNERTCYASVDMAHREPKTMKGLFFGIGKKVRTEIGSLATIHMSSCNSCRKKLALMDALLWIFLAGFIVLAFILVSIPAIETPMYKVNELLPLVFVVVIALAGYLIGKGLTEAYRKKISSEVKVDPSEVPLIRMMMDKGWFYFQDNKGRPRLFFKKQKTFGNLFCNSTAEGNVEKES